MSSGRRAPAAGGTKSTSKSVVELVKELTGASEEDIQHTLQECNYDVNEATNKLIDGGTFSSVVNKRQKKKQKEEERRQSLQKEAPPSQPKVLEVRRQAPGGGRDRGSRGGSRGGRGSRGGSQAPRGPPLETEEEAPPAEATPVQDALQEAPVSQPADPPPPSFSRTPGQPIAPQQSASPPVPIKPSDGANMSMAQRLFKQQQQPRPPPVPVAAQPPPQQVQPLLVPQLQNQPQAVATQEAASTPAPQPQQQPPASQPQLGISDPIIEKGAAVAAQAHTLATAPNLSDVPISHPPQAPPVAPAVNGLQQHAAPLSQQPPQPPPQQQHVPQHDSIAPGPPQGLGGMPVQPPPRQTPSFADSTPSASAPGNAWGAAPQKPVAQAAPGPNLGASLMASLGGGAGSGGLPQPSPPLSDPAIVSHSLGGSGSLGPLAGGQQDAAQPSPVIMPPSAHQTESGVDRVRLQFGQFGVGGEYGSSFNNNAASAPQHIEPQATAFQQQATNFASTSYGSQPSSITGQQTQQGDRLSSSLHSSHSVPHPFNKSGDLSAGQQQGQQQAPQQDQQQAQRSSAGAGVSNRPAAEQQQAGGQAASVPRPAATGNQYSGGGYGDLAGYGQQYNQYGNAFAQGQYDAFGGGGIGAGAAAGGDKRSSGFDSGYGFQSNLGTGYNQPQGKQDNLQSAPSAGPGFGSDTAAPGAAATGAQGQQQLHQQGYGPPGMGGYGYPQAAQYGYQGYGLAPPNYGYPMHPSAGGYQGYGGPQQQQQQQQQQQGAYGAPGRPNKQAQQQQPPPQQQQQQQQYSGYGSQGSGAGYGGLKDASGAGMGGGQAAPDANPYAGAAQAFHMQGQYSGYGAPQGRQQQGNFGGFGGYNAGGYGYGQMQGQANGDAFKMQ